MKSLKFNFTHPFKGYARVSMTGRPNFPYTRLLLDSLGSNLVEIPLNGLESGKYKVTLDWEIDSQFFMHQHEFEINDRKNFNPLTA